jgi:hypothetical protein
LASRRGRLAANLAISENYLFLRKEKNKFSEKYVFFRKGQLAKGLVMAKSLADHSRPFSNTMLDCIVLEKMAKVRQVKMYRKSLNNKNISK